MVAADTLLQRLVSRQCAPPDPILLVVAHPDDEVVGVGGQLARWAEHTVLLHITDGAPPDGVDARAAGFDSPQAYARARQREVSAAMGCLPRPLQAMTSFGVADRGATVRLVDIIESLRTLIETIRPAVVVAHAYEGGHPDHDAIAFAVRAAAAASAPRVDVVEFATYHEGADGRLVTNRFSESWRGVLPLVPAQRRLKRLMLACFPSQARVLAPFGCDYESLRAARPVDFSRPPASGAVWFDRRGWDITGTTWRAQAAAAASQLAAQGVTCSRF